MTEQTQDQTMYQVHLGELFEGPMDLLVYLVKKNEVDLYDIPIAAITEQYLEYLKLMKAMNVDVAGDFIVMAATLAYIKSRILLPAQEEQEEDAEDPRMEIVRPLKEYVQLKEAAEELANRDLLNRDVFVRSYYEACEPSGDDSNDLVQVSLFELIDAFQKIIKRVSPKDFMNITLDTISVKSRICEIADLLERQSSVTFEDLFDQQETRAHIIVTFLAILEMAKSQVIRIMQHASSGIIRIFNG